MYENKMPLRQEWRFSIIICPYYLKFGQTIVIESLWGHLLRTSVQAIRNLIRYVDLIKSPLINSMFKSMGQRHIMVYAKKKKKKSLHYGLKMYSALSFNIFLRHFSL
jgi:hypothetical protein